MKIEDVKKPEDKSPRIVEDEQGRLAMEDVKRAIAGTKEEHFMTKLKTALRMALEACDPDTVRRIAETTGVTIKPEIGNGIEFLGFSDVGQNAGSFMYEKKEGEKVSRWLVDPADRYNFALMFQHSDELAKNPKVIVQRAQLVARANAVNTDGSIKAEAANQTVIY